MTAVAAERTTAGVPIRENPITPSLCAHVGRRLAALTGGAAIGVGSTGGGGVRELAQACITGVTAAGGHAREFGACIESQFEFCLAMSRVDFGVYLDDGRLHVTRWSGAAAPLIDGELPPPAVRGDSGSGLCNLAHLYPFELMKLCDTPLEGLSVAVESASRTARELLAGTLERLGCRLEEGAVLTVRLSPDGKAAAMEAPGIRLTEEQVLAAVCVSEFRRGRSVALPTGAPRLIEGLALRYGGKVRRYGECRCGVSAGQSWPRDGLMQAVRLLSLLMESRAALERSVLPQWLQPIQCR